MPENAPGDEARLALLSSLEDEDFVPTELWHEAAWVLEDEALEIASEPGKQFLAQEREELARQVAAFAADFFRLDPAARRSRREELLRQAPPGPVAARLELLNPGVGLEVESVPVESAAFHAILSGIRELFVLPPPERARRRRQLARELDYSEHEIETALTLLRVHCPQWLDLANDFIAALVQSHLHSSRSFSVIAAGCHVALPEGTSSACTRQWVRASPPPVHERHDSPSRTEGRSSSDQRMWFFIIPIVMIVARVIMSTGGGPSRMSSPYTPPQRLEHMSDHAKEALQSINDPSRRNKQEVTIPLNPEGKLEILPPRGASTDDKTREALSRVLGLPQDRIRFKPSPKSASNELESTASDEVDPP